MVDRITNEQREAIVRKAVADRDSLLRPMADKPETLPEPDAWRYQAGAGGETFRYRGKRRGFDVDYEILKPEPLYTAATLRQAVKRARLRAIQDAWDAGMRSFNAGNGVFEGIEKLLEDENE